MNAQLGWWPFNSLFGMAPGQLTQSILPDWSLQRIDVDFAGDVSIEKEVIAKVASYGKQLGILTDAVLMLAGTPPKDGEDPIARLKEIAAKVEKLKKERETSLADEARDALRRLAKLEPATARRIAAEYSGTTVA
jgi:hypothetical protein